MIFLTIVVQRHLQKKKIVPMYIIRWPRHFSFTTGTNIFLEKNLLVLSTVVLLKKNDIGMGWNIKFTLTNINKAHQRGVVTCSYTARFL